MLDNSELSYSSSGTTPCVSPYPFSHPFPPPLPPHRKGGSNASSPHYFNKFVGGNGVGSSNLGSNIGTNLGSGVVLPPTNLGSGGGCSNKLPANYSSQTESLKQSLSQSASNLVHSSLNSSADCSNNSMFYPNHKVKNNVPPHESSISASFQNLSMYNNVPDKEDVVRSKSNNYKPVNSTNFTSFGDRSSSSGGSSHDATAAIGGNGYVATPHTNVHHLKPVNIAFLSQLNQSPPPAKTFNKKSDYSDDDKGTPC